MKLIKATRINDLELVKELIKEGYPLDEKNNNGSTALIIASIYDHTEIAKELIKAGASLNDIDIGNTALIYASRYSHVEIVKELIKAGASLTEINNYGNTALNYSIEIWKSYEIQDVILNVYPDKYKLLEEKFGIHKDILLKLKMKQILGI